MVIVASSCRRAASSLSTKNEKGEGGEDKRGSESRVHHHSSSCAAHAGFSSELPWLEVATADRFQQCSTGCSLEQAQTNAARPAPSHSFQAPQMNNMQMEGQWLLTTADACSLQVTLVPLASDAIWLTCRQHRAFKLDVRLEGKEPHIS